MFSTVSYIVDAFKEAVANKWRCETLVSRTRTLPVFFFLQEVWTSDLRVRRCAREPFSHPRLHLWRQLEAFPQRHDVLEWHRCEIRFGLCILTISFSEIFELVAWNCETQQALRNSQTGDAEHLACSWWRNFYFAPTKLVENWFAKPNTWKFWCLRNPGDKMLNLEPGGITRWRVVSEKLSWK